MESHSVSCCIPHHCTPALQAVHRKPLRSNFFFSSIADSRTANRRNKNKVTIKYNFVIKGRLKLPSRANGRGRDGTTITNVFFFLKDGTMKSRLKIGAFRTYQLQRVSLFDSDSNKKILDFFLALHFKKMILIMRLWWFHDNEVDQFDIEMAF